MSDKLNHFAVKFPAEMRENVMGLLKKKSQESHGIVAVTRNTSKLFGFATEESQRVWQSALAPLRGQGVQVLLAEGQYAFLKEEPAIPFDAKMLGPLVAPKPVFVAAERIKAIVEAAPPGPAHVESQSMPTPETELVAQAEAPAPIQEEPQPKPAPEAKLPAQVKPPAPLSVEDQSKPWYLRYPLVIPDSFKGYKPAKRTLRSIPVTVTASIPFLQPRAKRSAPAPTTSPKAAAKESSFARSFPGRHVTEAPAPRARRKRALPETESVPITSELSEPAAEPTLQPAPTPIAKAIPALKSVPVNPAPLVPLAAAPHYLLSLSSSECPTKILLCHLEETFGKDSFSLYPKKDGKKKVIETSVPLAKLKKEMKYFNAALRVLSPSDLQSPGRKPAKGR